MKSGILNDFKSSTKDAIFDGLIVLLILIAAYLDIFGKETDNREIFSGVAHFVLIVLFASSRWIRRSWTQIGPHLAFIEEMNRKKINVPAENVHAAAQSVSLAIKNNPYILAIMTELDATNILDGNKKATVISILKSPHLSEIMSKLICSIVESAVEPDYANNLYLKWLTSAKQGVKKGVKQIVDGGAPVLWEVNGLSHSNISETRNRVTDICLHLAKTAKGTDSSYFATETIPPLKADAVSGEAAFRDELVKILDQCGIEKRERLLIITYADLFNEVDGRIISHSMTNYIKWNVNSRTTFRILILFDDVSTLESSAFLENRAPKSLNFAIFGRKIVLAHNAMEKNISILDLTKDYNNKAGGYKTFATRAMKEQIEQYDLKTSRLFLSSNINDERDFLDLYDTTSVNVKSLSGLAPRPLVSGGVETPVWERCVFATSEVCPAVK